jgi:hypothetical protein
MQYYGYSEQELHGETYHQTMETGRIRIEDSVDGEIVVCGKRYWR